MFVLACWFITWKIFNNFWDFYTVLYYDWFIFKALMKIDLFKVYNFRIFS
jgi:hypothetical protein